MNTSGKKLNSVALLYDTILASFFLIVVADKLISGRWGLGKGLLGVIIMLACFGIGASIWFTITTLKANNGE